MKNKEYWKFILSKAFRTGLQSAISLYLANTSGIIDANALELIGVAFLSSFLSVIQNGLEQKNPKYEGHDMALDVENAKTYGQYEFLEACQDMGIIKDLDGNS